MKSTLSLTIVAVLLSVAPAFANDKPDQKAAQLRLATVAIQKLAWESPGKPSKSYKDAIKKHAKLNPEIAEFADLVVKVAQRAKQDKTSSALKQAGLKLKAAANKFTATFGEKGDLLPPRIEKSVLDAQIGSLGSIKTLLPKISP